MNQVLFATEVDLVTVVFDRLEKRQPSAGVVGGLRSGALDAFEAAVAEKVQELRELAARSVREGYEAVQGAVRSFATGVDEAAARLETGAGVPRPANGLRAPHDRRDL